MSEKSPTGKIRATKTIQFFYQLLLNAQWDCRKDLVWCEMWWENKPKWIENGPE